MGRTMNNDNSFNRTDFAQFLLQTGVATPGTEKYYVHWLHLFQRSRGRWPGYKWYEQLPEFLKVLKETKGRKEWQILQAEQAVRLYFTSYLNRYEKEVARQPLIIVLNKVSFSSAEALAVFQDSLRLKQFSTHIVKNYLHWTQAFFLYLENGNNFSETIGLIEAQYGVKKFMAHLAVQRDVSASTQNQAFSALSLFFRYVLDCELR